jgi:hypothetical protein
MNNGVQESYWNLFGIMFKKFSFSVLQFIQSLARHLKEIYVTRTMTCDMQIISSVKFKNMFIYRLSEESM